MAEIKNGPKQVWMFQPRIEHYRVPIWDLLQQQAGRDYRITVHGPLQDGHTFGGPARDYTHDLPYEVCSRLGQECSHWPGADALIERDKPDVVIVAANPRNLSCWKLPKVCRRIGAACVCWTKVHSFSGAIPPAALRLVKRRFFKRFDRAICYGESSFKELVSLGFPEDRARVAQNTIDTRRIFDQGEHIAERGRTLRSELGLSGRKVIVCIGRMDPEKRHGDLLDAWLDVKSNHPDLSLVLVSGGPLLEPIRQRAAEIDREHIHVLGRVPEGDDYAWLAAADLAVYPGAVGLAINQSLAIGCPTIIADESGADAEIITHGRTGWRFPRGDRRALVETINHVLADHEQRQRIVEQARTMMKEQVTIENMVNCIDTTIREALGDAEQRRSRR